MIPLKAQRCINKGHFLMKKVIISMFFKARSNLQTALPFLSKELVQKIREGPYEDQSITQTCRLIWTQKVPLKVQVFGWLHLRRRLMTHVFGKRLFFLNRDSTSAECIICSRGDEDCMHLFEWHLGRMIWVRQSILLDMTSEMSFWDSIQMGRYRKEGG